MKKNTADLATAISIILIITIIYLGSSCTKKEYVLIPTPYNVEEPEVPYEFSKSDLSGKWVANSIIQNGTIVTVFEPEKNVIIIEGDMIAFYVSSYYSTRYSVPFEIVEDSITYSYNGENRAFRFTYHHDSLLTIQGNSDRGVDLHLEFNR